MSWLRESLLKSVSGHSNLLTNFCLFIVLISREMLFHESIHLLLMYWPIELISPTSSHIEVVHMKFLKQLLGVQKQTSNVGVLLETGRLPLMVYAIKNVIKNWHRISNRKCNSLTYLSYVSIIENDIDWFGNISIYVNQIGCGNIL